MRLSVRSCALLASLAAGLAAARAPAADGPTPATAPILVLDAGGHSSIVTSIQFTPDGRELISTGADRTIRIWDVQKGAARRGLRLPIYDSSVAGGRTSALSPDGATLAVQIRGPR